MQSEKGMSFVLKREAPPWLGHFGYFFLNSIEDSSDSRNHVLNLCWIFKRLKVDYQGDQQTFPISITGLYEHQGVHHGKPVFRRVKPASQSSVIYFWDARDGPCVRGWWIAKDVNCDDEDHWAYANDSSSSPPLNTWKMPYNGPVEETLIVSPISEHIPAAPQTLTCEFVR